MRWLSLPPVYAQINATTQKVQWDVQGHRFRASTQTYMGLGPNVKVFPLHQGLENWCSQAKSGPLPGLVCAENGFYRWTFAVNLMIGNTNFEFYEVKCYPQNKNSMLLTSRSVLIPHPRKKTLVLNYHILNFVNKNFVEVCFLSCHISTYTISSILPLGPQSLIFTTGPFTERVSKPW